MRQINNSVKERKRKIVPVVHRTRFFIRAVPGVTRSAGGPPRLNGAEKGFRFASCKLEFDLPTSGTVIISRYDDGCSGANLQNKTAPWAKPH